MLVYGVSELDTAWRLNTHTGAVFINRQRSQEVIC